MPYWLEHLKLSENFWKIFFFWEREAALKECFFPNLVFFYFRELNHITLLKEWSRAHLKWDGTPVFLHLHRKNCSGIFSKLSMRHLFHFLKVLWQKHHTYAKISTRILSLGKIIKFGCDNLHISDLHEFMENWWKKWCIHTGL